jgi:Holliday junction DNA helicase RuvA
VITFLHGVLEEKQPTRAVLNVGGVGYEVLIPLSTFDRLPIAGESCRLLTHDHIREDAHQLFGFATESERDAFNMLTAVSGIGPKLALSALSSLSVRELKAAIVTGDTRRLSSISGVGKKTAERMIVELRDKIGAGEALEAVAGVGELSGGSLRDAMLALTALGYKQDEAARMVKQVAADAADAGVEELVRRALAGR